MESLKAKKQNKICRSWAVVVSEINIRTRAIYINKLLLKWIIIIITYGQYFDSFFLFSLFHFLFSYTESRYHNICYFIDSNAYSLLLPFLHCSDCLLLCLYALNLDICRFLWHIFHEYHCHKNDWFNLFSSFILFCNIFRLSHEFFSLCSSSCWIFFVLLRRLKMKIINIDWNDLLEVIEESFFLLFEYNQRLT